MNLRTRELFFFFFLKLVKIFSTCSLSINSEYKTLLPHMENKLYKVPALKELIAHNLTEKE